MENLMSSVRWSRISIAAIASAILLVSFGTVADAQSIELPQGDLRDIERQLQQIQNDSGRTVLETEVQAPVRPGEPVSAVPLVPKEDPRKKLSPLEDYYTERLRLAVESDEPVELRQYGYDLFAADGARGQRAGMLSGTVPDDYVLGAGDEIVVTLRGQVNRTDTLRVDREGRIILRDLPPIVAAGREFGSFRDELMAQVDSAFLETTAFVSLGSIRTVRVLVAGEVERPGEVSLNSFSTVLDAVAATGGMKKTGSLRRIRIQRAGSTTPVDLYSVLLGDVNLKSLRLQDGDMIVVPSIGRTIAVAGDVIRPGIYELPPGEDVVNVAQALDLAGGGQRPTGNEVVALRLDEAGRTRSVALAGPRAAAEPGDVVLVRLPRAAVDMEGSFEVPGGRSIGGAAQLSDILNQPDVVGVDTYLPFAVLQTHDPVTRTRRYIPFDLQRVLKGALDINLRARDTVILFGIDDIRYLSSADVQSVLDGQAPPSLRVSAADIQRRQAIQGQLSGQQPASLDDPTPPTGLIANLPGTDGTGNLVQTALSCTGIRALSALVAEGGNERFITANRTIDVTQTPVVNATQCPSIFDRHPDLLPMMLEYAVLVQGEVRFPGIYPALPGADLGAIVGAAGGFTLNASLDRVEITDVDGRRQESIQATTVRMTELRPGTVIRIGSKPQIIEMGDVIVSGEVIQPGRYRIRKGETLSALLQRAGGLTQIAYPYGTVFTRERVRVSEKQGFERSARELELAIPAALAASTPEEAGSIRAALPALQALTEQLRTTEAVGRVVVEADPLVLAARPELDFVLEPGDRIVIPKRPAHVLVSGEVLNPTAVMFRSGQTVRDYIRLAGGENQAADMSNVFIILPNGESVPARLGSWSSGDIPIPPGSTIVVPRDPAPFSFLRLAQTVTGLLRDLALSAASLAVITDNN